VPTLKLRQDNMRRSPLLGYLNKKFRLKSDSSLLEILSLLLKSGAVISRESRGHMKSPYVGSLDQNLAHIE
jgi:hypothetical protein